MATKKVAEKEEKPKKAKTEAKDAKRYFYAVGKRKEAVAQVRIYPSDKGSEFSVNDRKAEEYFPVARFLEAAKAPIVLTGNDGKFDVTVHVRGGGVSAQSEAVRLGVARALVKSDEEMRKSLRDLGFLTRDARIVERKKAGLKKARKSPQWAKR